MTEKINWISLSFIFNWKFHLITNNSCVIMKTCSSNYPIFCIRATLLACLYIINGSFWSWDDSFIDLFMHDLISGGKPRRNSIIQQARILYSLPFSIWVMCFFSPLFCFLSSSLDSREIQAPSRDLSLDGYIVIY